MKHDLTASLQEYEVIESEEWDRRTQSITQYKQAISVVKDYELVIRSKKKGILNVAYKQGFLFMKLKDSNEFGKMFQ